MTKTSIKRVLTRFAGAEFVNREQVKRCMGWGNGRTDMTLDGLDYITIGRTKQYDAEEVAERIYQQKRSS